MGPAWLTDLVNGDRWLGGSTSAGGRCRISEHHRAGRLRVWSAAGPVILRPGVERADAVKIAYAFEQATKLAAASVLSDGTPRNMMPVAT